MNEPQTARSRSKRSIRRFAMSGRRIFSSIWMAMLACRTPWVGTGACLCMVLAGCSGVITPPSVSYENTSPPPTEQAIAQSAKRVFTIGKLAGKAEISEPRRAHPLAPADWIVCLRSNVPPFVTYAVFFKGDQMANFRLAVLNDQCAREVYVEIAP
jgi:hypothetical protein